MENQKLDTYTRYIRQSLQRREDAKKDELVAKIGVLHGRMDRLVAALVDNTGFNTLGEIQGLASEIDRLTGELATIRQIKDDVRNLVGEAMIMDDVFGQTVGQEE